VTPTSDGAAVATQTKTPEVLIEEAENFAAQAGWAAKLAAINIIKQLRSDKLSAVLKNFLWEVAETDPEPAHRVAAAERLPQKTDSPEDINRIAERLKNETNERVLSIFIGLLSGASGAETRKTATDAIVGLLQADAQPESTRRLSDGTAIAALTILQTVASRDVTSEVLQWLRVSAQAELVQTTAISVLKKNSEQFGADVADKIISNDQILKAFTRHPLDFAFSSFRQDNVKKAYLRELLQANPLAYASKLLKVSAGIYVDDLLTFVLDLAFTANSQETTTFILEQLLGSNLVTPLRLHPSLRNMTEFQGRVLPYLRRQLPELVEQKRFTADQGKSIEAALATLETMPAPSPPLPKVNPGLNAALADLLKRTSPTNSSAFDEQWSPGRTYGLLAVSILLFLPGFFFYKWDLPAEASFGTVVASRFLLLVLDALMMYPFLTAIASAQATVRRETVSPIPNALYGALVPIAYGIYYTHTKYIGPLHFGAQALQFIINWPALMALFMAFRIYKP